MHRYKNGFGDYHYEYFAVYGLVEILDCILEVAALVICALISWKQREEIKKNRQEELSSDEMPVPDGINNDNKDAMKPEFTKPEKGKEINRIFDTFIEICRLVGMLIFAILSLFGDMVYAAYKKIVAIVINRNPY